METKVALIFLLVCVAGCLAQGSLTIAGDDNKFRTDGSYRREFLTNDPDRSLNAHVRGSHMFGQGMKPQYGVGGGFDYTAPHFNGGANVDHNFGGNTDVKANLGYRIVDKPRSSLDASAQYSQSFTPYGNSPPIFGGRLTYNFK